MQQIILDDLALDRKAAGTSLDELSAPFRQALKGMDDDEIDRIVHTTHARTSSNQR